LSTAPRSRTLVTWSISTTAPGVSIITWGITCGITCWGTRLVGTCSFTRFKLTLALKPLGLCPGTHLVLFTALLISLSTSDFLALAALCFNALLFFTTLCIQSFLLSPAGLIGATALLSGSAALLFITVFLYPQSVFCQALLGTCNLTVHNLLCEPCNLCIPLLFEVAIAILHETFLPLILGLLKDDHGIALLEVYGVFFPLLFDVFGLGLLQEVCVLFFHLLCPRVDHGHLLLPEGPGEVINALALHLAVADLVLALAQDLSLASLFNLVDSNVLQVICFDLCDLLAANLEVCCTDAISLFFHLLEHFLVLVELSFLSLLLCSLSFTPAPLLFLADLLSFGVLGFLPSLLFKSLLLLLLSLALTFFLAALDLFLSLPDLTALLLDALHNVGRELLLLQLLFLAALFGSHSVHCRLQLVANLHERLPHALHVHLARSSEDNGLVLVVDLNVDAMLTSSVGHPLLSNVERNDGCSLLKVVDCHVGIHLGELLHEPEEDDLLQRSHILREGTVEKFTLANLIKEWLGVLAE